MLKRLFIGVFLFFSTSLLFAGGNGPEGSEEVQEEATTEETTGLIPGKGINIKIMPALYLNTVGLELEVPLSPKFSIGINLLGALGRTDGANANFKVQPESFLDKGFAADLSLKYYFVGSAPTGGYIGLNGGYNSILYYDGNTRPYTLHNNWKVFDGLRAPSELTTPRPYSVSLTAGFQMTVIPKHLIVNAALGPQVAFAEGGGVIISVFMLPSIGYKF